MEWLAIAHATIGGARDARESLQVTANPLHATTGSDPDATPSVWAANESVAVASRRVPRFLTVRAME